MRASQDKNRDMARSILPSRYRSPVREQAKTRRRNRRTVNQHLRTIRTIDDVEEWDEDVDCRAYPDAEIKQIVQWRRAGDKLNHFERWAVRSTSGLPRDDRLSHLRAVLPEGLIGDHAMSHLRHLPELRPSSPAPDHRSYYEFHRARRIETERARHAWLNDVEAALNDLYDNGGQQPFNQAMRQAVGSLGQHGPPATESLIRTKAGIADTVQRALLNTATADVLLAHARRYRPNLGEPPGT